MSPQLLEFLKVCGMVVMVWMAVMAVSGCTQYRAVAKDAAQQAAQAQGETSRYTFCAGNTTGWLLRMEASERQEYIDYCAQYAR